ncbi:MAG: GNAT family N-acetyltransferase [Gammaproteobacteria bacterium]|nr:GNAT family N-acetyltransferase [Gammaproteobacteria bacterium]
MQVTVCHSLSEIDESEWDTLGKPDYPFTRHAFLYGLELHDCLEPFGWHPVYFLIREGGRLIAALPAYIKTNSYGELVFDHAWAQAYERHGFTYYPKLVTAIPYTPATGERFLLQLEAIDTADQQKKYHQLLVAAATQFCEAHKLSSWHILFEQESTLRELESNNFMLRCDIQFHWQNHQYTSFDHFLTNLRSRKRKNIRKERQSARLNNLDIQMFEGLELSDSDWEKVHHLYQSIYDRKYGTATLNSAFFKHLGNHMGKSVLVVLARDNTQIVACSVFFRSGSHLYGRIWGCDHYYRNLHFECCYYQGIDYCIRNQLQWFDPGAQGEHKLSRGFLPGKTWSGHWLNQAEFCEAIAGFLKQESRYIDDYQADLMKHSPYRQILL